MNPAHAQPWHWRTRASALEAEAALAWGAASVRLLAHLRALPAERLAKLSATANSRLLIVTGPTEDLPWAPGVAYAARCPEAPALWLPTTREPAIPADLLYRALHRRHGRQPMLLWPDPAAALPLDRLLPVSAPLLARVAERLGASAAEGE